MVRGSAVSIRWAAWRVGGMILIAMGVVSVAVAIGGLTFAGGGVIFLPLALPPLGAGYMVGRAMPGARLVAVLVAALYGAFIWSVATYPLGGLTPAPGQADLRQIDIAAALVACVFMTAAILVLIGRARRETPDR